MIYNLKGYFQTYEDGKRSLQYYVFVPDDITPAQSAIFSAFVSGKHGKQTPEQFEKVIKELNIDKCFKVMDKAPEEFVLDNI